MAVYRNIKCGNCNYSITEGYEQTGGIENFTNLGHETLTCPNCKTKNNTGKKPFNKMNIIEKFYIIIIALISAAVSSFAGSWIILSLSVFILRKTNIINQSFVLPDAAIIITGLVISILLFYIQYKNFPRQKRGSNLSPEEREKLFKEQKEHWLKAGNTKPNNNIITP